MKLGIDRVYNDMLPTIEKLYLQYRFIGLSKDQFMLMLREELVDSYNKYNYKMKISYKSFFKQQFTNRLKNYTNELLEDENQYKNIIKSYLNFNLAKYNDYPHNFNQIKNISDFFTEFNVYPDFDLWIEMINSNEIFRDALKMVVEKNSDIIKNEELEVLFDDRNFVSLIEAYCITDNVSFDDKTEDNIEDLYQTLNSQTKECVYEGTFLENYLHEINKPLLTEGEERQLAIQILKGDNNARDILIERNLKLVVSIAKKYNNRGIPLLDLIQEGNVGLMKAVDSFDVTKGYRFSTYAMHWITQTIKNSIPSQSRNIRVPSDIYDNIGKYKKAKDDLLEELNRAPTIEEISKKTGLSIKKIKKLNELQDDTISLNLMICEDSDSELESLVSSKMESPENMFIDKNMKEQVEKLFHASNLNSREIEVLVMRYGLDESEPKTLVEIGEKLNVTRERIRQMECRAIMKIRKSEEILNFNEYMDNPDQSLENINYFRKKYISSGKHDKTYLNDVIPDKSKKNMTYIKK